MPRKAKDNGILNKEKTTSYEMYQFLLLLQKKNDTFRRKHTETYQNPDEQPGKLIHFGRFRHPGMKMPAAPAVQIHSWSHSKIHPKTTQNPPKNLHKILTKNFP